MEDFENYHQSKTETKPNFEFGAKFQIINSYFLREDSNSEIVMLGVNLNS